jgi:rhomboid family GlyGly-CTERM serine protease
MTDSEKLALAGAALLLLLQAATPLHAALEYRQAAASAQPWRLLTGHLVHLNWPHALVNAAAWWIVVRLFAPELDSRRQLGVIAASAAAIGTGLWLLHPAIAFYRGFSGVLHALFFAGASAWLLRALADQASRNLRALWLPAMLLAGGAIKVAFEQPAGSGTPYADWLGANVVPQAHLLGAATGVALGAAFAWRGPPPGSRAG